jgi:hypothetical protein
VSGVVLILGLPAALGVTWLAWLFLTAPKGYEDERGYHKGDGPRKQRSKRPPE